MATPAGPWKRGPYWMMIEVRYRQEVTNRLYVAILIEIFSLKCKARAMIVRTKKRFPICQNPIDIAVLPDSVPFRIY